METSAVAAWAPPAVLCVRVRSASGCTKARHLKDSGISQTEVCILAETRRFLGVSLRETSLHVHRRLVCHERGAATLTSCEYWRMPSRRSANGSLASACCIHLDTCSFSFIIEGVLVATSR